MKYLLALVMILVLAVGWRYPLLGYVVPLVMTAGIVGGFLRGRYVCGNLCPRGAFWDSWFFPLGGKRPIPNGLRTMVFRWSLAVVLMGFMLWRGLQNPTSLEHWGAVFWLMCAVTTAVGVILGMVYDSRAWCTLCPVGTLARVAGKEGTKRPLHLDTKGCTGCRICHRVCPMQLQPLEAQKEGKVVQPDCVQCSVCVNACPRNVLSWDKAS